MITSPFTFYPKILRHSLITIFQIKKFNHTVDLPGGGGGCRGGTATAARQSGQ